MEQLRELTLELYKKCADYALSKGIIIADTKFEFGLDEKGNIVLGDEMLTPDNSRFWPLEGYEAGKGQPSYKAPVSGHEAVPYIPCLCRGMFFQPTLPLLPWKYCGHALLQVLSSTA